MAKKLLLVDDDVQLLRHTADFIKDLNQGWEVDCAVSGMEARGKVENKRREEKDYDVILSDYEMSEINGIDLRFYLQDLDFRGRFYLMSGAPIQKEILDVLGIDGFMNKPFSLPAIRKILEDA